MEEEDIAILRSVRQAADDARNIGADGIEGAPSPGHDFHAELVANRMGEPIAMADRGAEPAGLLAGGVFDSLAAPPNLAAGAERYVELAKNCIVNKRSMKPGYAGIENDLFFQPKTSMLFGDAKKVLQDLIGEIKNL